MMQWQDSSNLGSPDCREQYPSLSPAKRLFSFAAFLLLFLGVLVLPAKAQISPGPLARAHKQLDGPTNCTKCHMAAVRSRAFRCLDCHREIAAELDQHKGLHATFPQGGAPGAACVKCHSDHNGENFALLHWDPTPKGFDHSKAGFLLDGKHTAVDCRSCHNAAHIPVSSRSLLQNKDLNHTFLGLSTLCSSCHQDKHQGRFGSNCAQCHSTIGWKSAKIDEHGFDHAKTRFPLTGLHKQVSCQKCHTPGSDGQPRFTGLTFSTCASCHADPHKGQFKKDCDSCHTTASWKKSTFSSTFDHSKTGFPLLGKHTEVDCVTCHKGVNFKVPIAHTQCADCHKPDPHNGQFAKRPDGGRCESCHTIQGWRPSTFSVADHAKTGFPLIAPHAKVECGSCHIPAGRQTRFRLAFALCVDCHKDPHNGQFAKAPWSNRCEQCHTGLTFKSTNYTITNHKTTAFPLTGSHLAVPCNQCHKPMEGSKVTLFHFANLSCTTCHEDIHKGQFASRMTTLSSAGKPTGCEACHSTKQWSDLSRFDHSTTKFKLEGSHRALACKDCHQPPNLERTMLHVKFSSAPTVCSECHQNPHAEQFGARANACATCHNTNKWKPSLFDHEQTAFSLKGGHQNVACSACHMNKKIVNGQTVLFYKPTPTACADCHSDGVPKTVSQLIPSDGIPVPKRDL